VPHEEGSNKTAITSWHVGEEITSKTTQEVTNNTTVSLRDKATTSLPTVKRMSWDRRVNNMGKTQIDECVKPPVRLFLYRLIDLPHYMPLAVMSKNFQILSPSPIPDTNASWPMNPVYLRAHPGGTHWSALLTQSISLKHFMLLYQFGSLTSARPGQNKFLRQISIFLIYSMSFTGFARTGDQAHTAPRCPSNRLWQRSRNDRHSQVRKTKDGR
jgi:hypothetical protein